jgi:lambda family phage tail tape measure protein
MAALDYSVNVTTNTAIQSLERLQKSVSNTSAVFDKLKTAVAGLAIGSVLQQLASYADEIDDISKANNLAIESVLGFGKALEYNGGRADAAATGLATFTSNISEAADGSAKLQDTFRRLNVSLTDLGNLSEQALLDKVLKELSQIDNASLRASLSTQLFGRALKGVDLKGLQEDYAKYKAEQAANAPAIAAAAQANENLSRVLGQLKIELLASLKPISDLAASLLEFGSFTKSAIKWIIDFGVALASLWAVFRVGKIAVAVLGAIPALFGAIGEVAGNVAGLFRVMFNPILRSDLLKNLSMAGGIMGGLGTVARAIFGSIEKLGLAFGALGAAIYATYQSIKKFFGWGDDAKKDSDKASDADKAAAEAAREVQDAYAKKAKEIAQVSENFAKANARIIDNINLENQLLGKSKEYSDVIKAQEELYKRSVDEIDKLRDAKEALTAEEQRAGLGAKYDEQIAKIKQQTEIEAERVKRSMENANRLQQIEQFRLFGIKAEIDSSNQLQTIQDNIAKSVLPELQKKYYDIDAAAKASAKSAIEAEEARRNTKMPIEEQKKYYEEAAKGSAQLKAAAEEEYKNSRKFSTGWSQAFNEYVDNATNAATQAQRIFQSFTQGMEDLLMNLFKTGKFGWKDFVQNIIDVLMRSQIQQLIAKTFGGINPSGGGGGGLLGGSIIPGILAGGGPAAMNRPYIVGERGPELFVPSSNGQMVPNSGLGGGSNVVYNINAVDAMSFKQMLARDPSFLYAVSEQGRRTLPGVA